MSCKTIFWINLFLNTLWKDYVRNSCYNIWPYFFTFDMYVSKLLGAVNEASKTSLAKELFSWLIWIIFEILWIIFNLKFLRLVLKMRLNIIDWQRTVKVIKKREKHSLHVQRRFLWSYLYNLVLFYFIHVPMFRSCVPILSFCFLVMLNPI